MRRFFMTVTMFAVVVVGLAVPIPALAQNASPGASPVAGIVEFAIDVDGRSLHAACAGTGEPTVFFETGGPFAAGGASVVYEVGPDVAAALGVRFCAYDRAGTGQSAPDPMGVRSFKEAAADLNGVLASPELGCPCVVIGESLGGSIALVALAEDTTGFGGLLLLDAPYPGYLDEFIALAPASAPEASLMTDPAMTGENEERMDVAAGFQQVASPAKTPAFPVIVVSHGAGDPPGCYPCSAEYPVAEAEAAWQAGQADLANAIGGRLVIAEQTGHSIANENPGLVVGLAAEVIAAVRDPSIWAMPAATPAT